MLIIFSAAFHISLSDPIRNHEFRNQKSRVPLKSVARLRCVSKQWASILGRPYFKELFLTRSSAKSCLLFAIEEDGTWSFFSLPQRQNPYHENPSSSSSSLVVAAEFQTDFPGDDMWIRHHTDLRRFASGYASGFIYFSRMTRMIEDKYYDEPVIFNPNTRMYVILPSLEKDPFSSSYSFFGFDPIDKQFKALFMGYAYESPDDDHRIITLGTGMRRWRKIECSLRHHKKSQGICINGVLYYLGATLDEDSQLVIVCFDVRFEKFKFIDVEWYPNKLINYKGKLCMVYSTRDHNEDIELGLWVLENVEKQEWYTLSEEQFFQRYFTVVGATASGEIVFSTDTYSSYYEVPFYVFYFNPERKTFQSVGIKGFGDYLIKPFSHHVYTFVDHVEDLNVKITFKRRRNRRRRRLRRSLES